MTQSQLERISLRAFQFDNIRDHFESMWTPHWAIPAFEEQIRKADHDFQMDWDGLLKTNDFNFLHDIVGIIQNFNEPHWDYFAPRFSR